MGKRNRNKNSVESEEQTEEDQISKVNVQDAGAETSSLPVEQVSQKRKKDKISEHQHSESDSQASAQNSLPVSKNSSKKSKRAVFVDDDEPVDAPDCSSQKNTIRNKKQNFNSEEDEVNEEDIDKFCEELPEQENSQYDDWVKLIEAKLNPNKKT